MAEHRPFFILAAIILAAALGDLFLNNGDALLFLMKKSLDAIEWIKFWN
jgi:hypothetical protein